MKAMRWLLIAVLGGLVGCAPYTAYWAAQKDSGSLHAYLPPTKEEIRTLVEGVREATSAAGVSEAKGDTVLVEVVAAFLQKRGIGYDFDKRGQFLEYTNKNTGEEVKISLPFVPPPRAYPQRDGYYEVPDWAIMYGW